MDFFVDIDCADDSARELVEGVLFRFSTLGSVTGDTAPITTRAYFDSPSSRDIAATALRELDGVRAVAGEAGSTDWLEHYEQSLQAIHIGKRFLVAPDERLIDDTSRLAIIIPQEQAFGTGSHATTAMCLAAMEALEMGGATAIDVGTGTGILAIGMAASGARRVFAFDNDFDTFEVLRKNLARNAPRSSGIRPFFGSLDSVIGQFDVMTVNILAEVIIELLPEIVRRLSEGGYVILSGVIIQRRDEVMRAADAEGLERVESSEQGEWWCGTYQRPSS